MTKFALLVIPFFLLLPRFCAGIFNTYCKPSFNATNINGSWYSQYTGAFLTALQQGASMDAAHNAAGSFADIGRPVPGSTVYQELFKKVRRIPISAGGGLL